MTSLSVNPKPYGSRRGYTGSCGREPHIGGSGQAVALYWNKAAMEFGSLMSDRAALFRIALFAFTARGRGLKRCPNNSLPYHTLASIPTTARVVGKASSLGLASATFGHTMAALLTDYAHGHLRQRRTNNNNNTTEIGSSGL